MEMKVVLAFLICVLFQVIRSPFSLAQEAYPYLETCGLRMPEPETPIHTRQKIIDITHAMRPDLPSFEDAFPNDAITKLTISMEDGNDANISEMQMIVHTGTHLDAPGHYVNEHYVAGFDVDGLDLNVLVGPVLIVDTPRDRNLTAKVLQDLNIPKGVERVLFRTANTDNGLMWNPYFDSSYTGFSADGAEWLVTHRPDVKLVGTDYLSVAMYEQCKAAHRTLLWKKLILVEGLNLDRVPLGLSNLYCLPLRLVKAEGSPVRCILIN